ncbi:MAG: phenylalanine--tRNA ligase subunit alpha, partial [Gemmatimonadaceae bacterium]
PRLREASTPDELELARVRFLARNAGWRATVLKDFGELDRDAKRELGGYLNEVKNDLEALYETQKAKLGAAVAASVAPSDLTMPARHQWRGARHPVTLVIEEIVEIFRELGFTVALGPQVETDWYNFGALNFPADHPALDAHDTLYIHDDILLRTHTSPVQIRTLQRFPPPIRILAPGDVFRRDFFDASHAPMFAQIEGLCIDEGITFVDLKAMLSNFARRFFGAARTRFRPSYFPFTEPSAELDVQCQLCKGAGCTVCKGTGWTEILGSGMVHPKVLEAAGVDSEKYTGWAFGMGPARAALQRYDIPDMRILYDSDVRFLEQVAR